jgi:hypothetical protein
MVHWVADMKDSHLKTPANLYLALDNNQSYLILMLDLYLVLANSESYNCTVLKVCHVSNNRPIYLLSSKCFMLKNPNNATT